MFPIHVQTTIRKVTKLRLCEYVINAPNVHATSWLGKALAALSEHSRILPVAYTTAHNINRVISLLATARHSLGEVALDRLSEKGVLSALANLETDISCQQSWGASTRASACCAFRRLLNVPGATTLDGVPLADLFGRRPQQLRRPRARPSQHAPPLPWLPGASVSELERLTLEELQSSLAQYTNAAEKELSDYYELCALQNCMEIEAAGSSQQLIPGLTSTAPEVRYRLYSKGSPKTLNQNDVGALLIACHRDTILGPLVTGYGLKLCVPSVKRLPKLPLTDHYKLSSTAAPWFYSRHRLPNALLTAIFILLLARTGWNISSVASLTLESLKPSSSEIHTIQAWKSKTDDGTPEYLVERYDTPLRDALALLAWNLAQLKIMGLVADQETRLWFGWQRDGYQQPLDPISPKRLSLFQKKGVVEHTPLSDFRDLNAQITYLRTGSLEAVRQLLGHKDIETTCEYLCSTAIFKMHEAMILRYQRELDNTAQFLNKDQLLTKRSVDKRFVATKLLVPTGDGGQCDDPCDSPSPTIAEGGKCDGLWCHAFGRCKHYRLVVNPAALRDAIRTYRFYCDSWSQLAQQNPERFESVHIPRLVFLLLVVKLAKEAEPAMLERAISEVARQDHADA